jgi:type IX secretion system PorP/SprF family membrane protein
MFNPIYYNPATVGIEGLTKITAVHRSQWLGYGPDFGASGGAPSTQVLAIQAPLFKFRSGVGIHIANDNLGPVNNLEVQASYAYQLAFKKSKISFGVRLGVYSQTLDNSDYNPIDDNDPIIVAIEEGNDSQVRPDVAAGIYYQAEKFYIGLSATHLTQAEFNFGQNVIKNPLENHGYFTAGYNYEFNYKIVITPTLLVRTDFNEYNFDFGVIGTYDEKVWGGLSYRQGEAAVLMVGYSFTKNNALGVGYAFDLVLVERDAKAATSHEFMLTYNLPVTVSGGKKVVRTPRFRY